MTGPIPFGSILLEDMVSTPEMRAIWTEDNMIAKWIEVEKAITSAQAELGMVPKEAAEVICQRLSLQYLTPELIRKKKETYGHVMVSFIKAFREICGEAAEHFHVGPTTQDILDSGLTLQMREAHYITLKKMLELEMVLCDQALEYKDAIMMGRTHRQHAVPTTLGFILAVWASEIRDHIARAKESEKRWLFGNLSGVVGTQNSLVELSDTNTARKLQQMVCAKLDLNTPLIDLHSRTDRFAEVIRNLTELCSFLGRIGLNIRDWQQSEVMEVEEPCNPTQCHSSTLPNKQNPASSEIAEGLATVCRGLASAMENIRMPITRDETRIPVHFTSIPMVYMLVSTGLSITLRNITGLVVHRENMIKNLNHPNVLQQAASERIMMAMYRKTGEKDRAYTLLHQCARRSYENRVSFREVILKNTDIAELFTPEELDKLLDLTTYTGTAVLQTESAVRVIKKEREED
jgi:adenylosuccinate lyase